jgi:hypothetical protein
MSELLSVESSGIGEMNGAIRRFKESIPTAVQQVAFEAAGITVSVARPTIPSVSGQSARSLQHYLVEGGAEVEGGKTVEHYRWLELGGASGRKHTNVRPIVSDGRYIFPAYEHSENKIQALMEAGLNEAIRDSGLEG